MSKLNNNSSFEEMEKYMLYHIFNADDRKSKINPSLTKEQVWNINMSCVTNQLIRVKEVAIANLIREFGSYYE